MRLADWGIFLLFPSGECGIGAVGCLQQRVADNEGQPAIQSGLVPRSEGPGMVGREG